MPEIRLSGRRTVNKLTMLPILLLICFLSTTALPQRSKHPAHPSPMNPYSANTATPEVEKFPRHVDLVQLQKDADDLARTAQTIPSDVASVRKGMLPKDIIQKLKQIEKLSKHLRTQLNP
jgi:hypothetical protein